MATPWNETKIVKMYDTGSRAGMSNTRTPVLIMLQSKSHVLLFSPVIHVSPMTVTSDTDDFNQELYQKYILQTMHNLCLYHIHIPHFLPLPLPLLVSTYDNYCHDKEANIHQENNHHWHDERQNKISVGVQPAAASTCYYKTV